MIGKVTRGRRVGGLLRYLYGPGRHNEHTHPHLVAAWDDPATLEPVVLDDGRHDVAPLARLLDQPLRALPGDPPDRAVWHCSLRAAPGDRRLADDEWADLARDVVARTGLARAGDDEACRWVAVRHAEDHIHLVVTLSRQDGGRVSPRNDYYRVGEACREAERRHGLAPTATRDRTSAVHPTRAEQEKAQRSGRPEPARTTLRREVRAAASSSSSSAEFLDRLRSSGLLVRERLSERNPDEITGYAVAMPDQHAADGGPVWFGGGKLAADLTLPKLRRRWDLTSTAARTGPASREPREQLNSQERQAVWAQAQRAAQAASEQIRALAGTNPAAAADAAWAASDALAVSARLVEGRRGGPMTRAAEAYDRAGREAWGRIPQRTPTGNGLRSLARLLALTGRARHDETTQLLSLVLNLIALTQAVAQLREAQGRAAQAAAAHSAAEHLRQAVPPLRRTVQPPARRPRPARHASPTDPRPSR